MYNHIKIKQIKALHECQLNDLGKINIVCGKNNSGKSTLLEGIANKDNRFCGFRIDTDDDAPLSFLKATGRDQSSGSTKNDFLRLMSELSNKKNMWYEDEYVDFRETFEKCAKNQKYTRFQYNDLVLKQVFDNNTSNKSNPVLLPPKRNLELKKQISTNMAVEPNGIGLIQKLFYLRNQNTGSKDLQLYNDILDAFEFITQGYKFEISLDPSNFLELKFSKENDPWIVAPDCGLGLQEALVITYFSLNNENNVVIIEEPEAHLHPEMQRKVLYFLGKKTDKQFFISTHSNVFLDNAFIDRVFFTYFNNEVSVSDATSRASILHDLGYSITDNLTSDLVILTEGPTDIPIVEEFLVKYGLSEKYNIKTWPLGGDIMSQVDLSVFSESYKIIALVDGDPGSAKIRNSFVRKCRESSIPVTHLKCYAIENCLSLRAIKKIFKSQVPDTVEELEPHKKLENQIGINIKKSNRKIARAMTIDEIEKTELARFFSKVEKLCQE